MAELGDFLAYGSYSDTTQGRSKTGEIDTSFVTVEMMDFDYVEKCKDTHTLRGILQVLRTGKEGYYPQVR